MKRTFYTFLLSAVFAVSLMGYALADIATPTIFKPRGYLPVLIIAVAVIVIVVIIKRKQKSSAKSSVKPVITSAEDRTPKDK